MEDYALIVDPKSKGTKILLYDKKQDVFYTAPIKVFSPPEYVNRWMILLMLTSLFLGLLCNLFIYFGWWNRYLFISILVINALISYISTQKYLQLTRKMGSLACQNTEAFTIVQNLQTAEQRRSYLRPIGSLFLGLKSFPTLLLMMFCILSETVKQIYHYNAIINCMLLILISGSMMLTTMGINTFLDNNRRYLWKKFVRKK